MSHQDASLRLETSAERTFGKEISLVGTKDFNHLDLIIEAKNNRLKAEFFYIYDYEKFNNCSLLQDNFNIFKVQNGINHNSARIVIHYLTKELKRRYGSSKKGDQKAKHKLTEIFKPSLNQFNDDDILTANKFIKEMFPFEGCSYTGAKLDNIIAPVRFLTLVLALRTIWSLLPGAILPWKSFKDFYKNDEVRYNFKNYQSFYDDLPKFLPSYNHACILFEFLEIFLSIFNNDYFLDLNNSIDLIFTAGQICFNRDEYKDSSGPNTDDLTELHEFYRKRGSSFYTVFISYLRSLSKEVNSSSSVEFKTLFDFFKIEQFPPLEHKPLSQKALALTIPSNSEDGLDVVNYFKLISNASNSTSRIYSSNHSFTKFENKFLDKFEINPYKIIDNFFSKSSKNYLLKFDKTLNFEDFKINDQISDMRSNLKNNATLFENKEFVSTFINEFNRYGFESGNQSKNNNSDTFLNDTINFNFSSNMEAVDKLPVRVSKLEITEWFINSWKYETFLGFLTNTIVIKLTKTIGDCDWLIISSNDKISLNNRYLTPEVDVDSQKERELGGSLEDEDNNNNSKSKKKTSSPQKTSPQASSSASSSPKQRRSPKSKDLKRISFPSQPNSISNFEKKVSQNKGLNSFDPNGLSSNNGKNSLNKLNNHHDKTYRKPLPAPMIPNQRITTPLQQVSDGFKSDYDTPSMANPNGFLPPPLVKNSVNDNSLVSNFENNLNMDDHSDLQAIFDAFDKPNDSGKDPRVPSSLHSNPRAPLAADGALQKPFSPNLDTPKKEKRVSNHPYQQLKDSPPREVSKEEDAEKNEKTEPSIAVAAAADEVTALEEVKAQVLEVEVPKLKSIDSPSTIETSTVGLVEKEEFEEFSETKPKEAPLPPLRTRSTSHFETPSTSGTDKFGTNSPFSGSSTMIAQSSKMFKSAASPIAQAFPKFSFLTGKKENLKKISSSESSNSLAFINDGSVPNSETIPVPQSNSSRNSSRISQLIPAGSEVPEIPYTPKAFRDRVDSIPSSPSLNSPLKPELHKTSTIGSFTRESLSDAIQDNRGSFIVNSSLSSKENGDVFDDEEDDDDENSTVYDSGNEANAQSNFTEDTTKISATQSKGNLNDIIGLNVNLDGLLEEIKKSMSAEDVSSNSAATNEK